MFEGITLGQYVYMDSWVHKMDPRIKIILTIALMIAVFLIKNIIGYVIYAVFLLAIILISKVPLRLVLRSLRPLLFIMIVTFFINLFFVRTGNIIFKFYFISFTNDGLNQAVKMAFRFVFLLMGSSLLTLTTTPMAMTYAMESLFSPLKIIRFPAHELAMIMTIALRFIPTLLEEANKIIKAQMARGADFESGNVFNRVKALVPVLVPLFVSAFRSASELTMAMESRCYHGGEGRTRMTVWHVQSRDYISLLVFVLLFASIIVWGR